MCLRESRHIGVLPAILILVVIVYALSVGPVFDYYANQNPDVIDSLTARVILKAYIPLYIIAPDAAAWYVGRYANLSSIETYFMMHQEKLSNS